MRNTSVTTKIDDKGTLDKQPIGPYHRFSCPIELAVVHVALALEQVLEDTPQVVIIRSLEEVQSPHVPQVVSKLLRVSIAQYLDRSRPLRIAYLLVALLQCLRLQALPRQWAAQEIHKHVTQRLQVISTRLLSTEMCVYWHVPRRAGQRFMLPIWYVLIRI